MMIIFYNILFDKHKRYIRVGKSNGKCLLTQNKNQIKDFVSLTGASDKQAERYLSKAKGNMQNAINLYFDDGGVAEVVDVGVLPEIQNLFAKLSGML